MTIPKLFCFLLFGFYQSYQFINMEEDKNKTALVDSLCLLTKLIAYDKMAIWYSSEQMDMVSKFVENITVPIIINSVEKLTEGSLDLRRACDLVIIFNNEKIDHVINSTLRNADTRFLVLSQNITKVKSDFKKFWEHKVINAFEIILVDDELTIYGFHPYSNNSCDKAKLVVVDKFLAAEGAFKNNGSALIDQWRIKNMNQCTLKVATVHVKPTTIFINNVNKTNDLRGIEGQLVQTIAEKLNFKANFSVPDDGVGWGWIRPSPHGAVGEVFMGKSDIAIGLLAPTLERREFLELSVPYNGKECITYAVPSGAGVSTPYWIYIIVTEFGPFTWLFLGVTFVVIFFVLYLMNKCLNVKIFSDKSEVLLYQLSSCFSLPVKIPDRLFFRLAVLSWLLFCFVVTIAYKSSISSKLTVPLKDPDIASFEELIRTPLHLTGYNNMLRLMQYNGSDSTIQKMSEKFKVTEFNLSSAVRRISSKRRIAYMGHTSGFLYYSLVIPQAKGQIYVMTDCILSYYPTVMTRKHSPLINRINQLVSRLKEGGFPIRWRAQYIYDLPPPPNTFLKLSTYHVYGIFCILFGGYALSILLFCMESISGCKKRRKHRWNH